MPAYLVTMPDVLGRTLVDGADQYVVFAADETDAKAIVNDRFAGDSTALVDDATITEIEAASDLAGFSLRVQVSPMTPAIDITVGADGSGAVAATGVLTATDAITNTETVTIGARVYTFQDTLTNVAGNVKVGASASETLDNLIAAINLAAGAGTLYAAATTVHPTVTAAAGAADTMNVTAKVAGAAGNAIATTATTADASFGALTLEGGVDADSIDSLGQAMAAALNADTVIDGAAYDIDTQTLTVAVGSGGDDLGDKTVTVALYGPRGNTPIAQLIDSVTDGGASTDDLEVVFVADNYEIPQVLAALKS